MVLTIFHFAFASWGVLMWVQLSDTCADIISGQYSMMLVYHHISVAHNAIFFTLMLVHEAYLGSKLGSDFTLMSEIHQQSPGFAAFTSDHPTSSPQPPGTLIGAQQPGSSAPPSDMPALNSDIAKDYEDIIKSPPGHLPQGQP